MTDSYHFQIEPEPAKEALFRKGGVYLDGYGTANYVQSVTIDGRFLWVRSWSEGQWDKSKFRHLANGKFDCLSDEDSQHHLLPGEVALRGDGEWVAADSIGPFPSGATLKVAGDKIVGRVEAIGAGSGDIARAPLPHFNQRTEFDPFPDYVVFHEFEPTAPLHTSPTTDSAYPAIAGLLRG